MNSAELLHGASAAAQTVSDAHGDALRGNNAALDALHEHGALHSSLHQRLCEDAARCQRQQGAAAAMEATLQQQRSHLLGAASVENVRLVVGAHRATWSGGGMRRLDFLPSLAIVARRDVGSLWSMDTQQHLLEDVGCTVQLWVRYEAAGTEAATAGPSQLYLFEAAVTGSTLISNSAKPRSSFAGLRFGEVQAADGDDEPAIALVDINGMVGNDVFWHSAAEANPFPFQ